jgi:hypothetical protein
MVFAAIRRSRGAHQHPRGHPQFLLVHRGYPITGMLQFDVLPDVGHSGRSRIGAPQCRRRQSTRNGWYSPSRDSRPAARAPSTAKRKRPRSGAGAASSYGFRRPRHGPPVSRSSSASKGCSRRPGGAKPVRLIGSGAMRLGTSASRRQFRRWRLQQRRGASLSTITFEYCRSQRYYRTIPYRFAKNETLERTFNKKERYRCVPIYNVDERNYIKCEAGECRQSRIQGW